jgi:hypothetical protein
MRNYIDIRKVKVEDSFACYRKEEVPVVTFTYERAGTTYKLRRIVGGNGQFWLVGIGIWAHDSEVIHNNTTSERVHAFLRKYANDYFNSKTCEKVSEDIKITLSDPNNVVYRLIYKKIDNYYYGCMDLRQGWRGKVSYQSGENDKKHIHIECEYIYHKPHCHNEISIHYTAIHYTGNNEIYYKWSKNTLEFVIMNQNISGEGFTTIKKRK